MLIENCQNAPAFKLKPVKFNSILRHDENILWGGSMTRTPDGKCHLFLSVWPRKYGFESWPVHSQVAYAVSDSLHEPFDYKGIVFHGSRKPKGWDRDVIHNPTVHYWDGKFYLYYTGNFGNGEYWNHRNNQRIGVAIAENPFGPWKRFDKPLLDISHGCWDCLLTTNPSVCRMPDGRYILIYKAVGDQSPPPMCGPVLHGVAFSESPTGPFIKHETPVFTSKNINFPGEDPYVFTHKGMIYTILKDVHSSYYPSVSKSLVLFQSKDGINWELSENTLVATRNIVWEDGSQQEVFRLERPQLYIENGSPVALFTAVKPSADIDDAYNIHFDLS